MRALHFAKPLEYRLEISGEAFVQGTPISGKLTVCNRGSQALTGLRVEIGLAFAAFKVLKETGSEAMEMLDKQTIAEALDLKPAEEISMNWQLDLTRNCPVKTKDEGPFLLYGGSLDKPRDRGQIDLPVEPHPTLEAFITTLENHFAFEARTRRFKDGILEIRFKPPERYATLEEFDVFMSLNDSGATLSFNGKYKGLRRGVPGDVETRKTQRDEEIPKAEFEMPNGQPNRSGYRTLLEEVLKDFAPAFTD